MNEKEKEKASVPLCWHDRHSLLPGIRTPDTGSHFWPGDDTYGLLYAPALAKAETRGEINRCCRKSC